MIDVLHVSKTYPSRVDEVSPDAPALSDINLLVEKGERVVLAGPSGAGKTTLLKILWSAERADAGRVRIDGQDVAEINEAARLALRRRIGFIAQDFTLMPDRTVFDNVALPMEIAGYTPRDMTRRVRETLGQVHLDRHAHRASSSLSGGERQRAAIARALVCHPMLLLADEPTSNLDDTLADHIMGLLKEVNVMGTTLVVATRNCAVVTKIAGRTILLQAGRLLSDEKSPG